MEDLDLNLDFDIDTTNILSDYTTSQLIEELNKRGAETIYSSRNKGLNIPAVKGIVEAIIFRHEN